jgi:hypothetical protein
MRQILLAAIMSANGNHEQFPPDLATILNEQEITADAFIDPLHPQEKVGYVYIRPSDGYRDADKAAILFQSWQEGRLVGFADAHVEWMSNRQEVEKIMESARQRSAGASGGASTKPSGVGAGR